MVFNNNLLLGAAGAAGGYTIDQSIRFNSADSAFLSRTPSSGSAATQYAISVWCKRGLLDEQYIFMQGSDASNLDVLQFQSDATLRFQQYPGSLTGDFITTQVFRDVGSWYHIVVIVDTTQGTAGDRVKIYVNGSRVTNFSTQTNPGSNATSMIGGTTQMTIGRKTPGTIHYHDGYMAEFNMVFGTPSISDFGETNADTGQWVPIEYTGSYGTNGFYITGADSADLGADYSGNGNDFTSSGLTSADQRTDTPTNNHCTFNPLWIDTYTLSDGNLVTSTGADASALGTMAVDATDSDGWYWEMKVTTAATYPGVGIILASQASLVANTALSGTNTNRYYYQGWDGQFNNQNSATAYGSTWSGTANKVIGVYLKGGALWFSIDGVVQNSGDPSTASTGAAITGLTGDFYPVAIYPAGSGTQAAWTAQFAEADWGTTPPSGYKAINTANLPDPTIADPSAHFQTTLYTGNGTAIGSGGNAVDQSGNSTFQPDFVWIKNRSAADNHMLYDAVRGATKDLHSNTTDAEATDTEGLSTFDADGFTVGSNVEVNTNTENYVAWQWKANGAGSSNTDGTITSTVSANTTSGFSIVTYNGNSIAGATVGHGLGQTPKFVVVKCKSAAGSWPVYLETLGPTKYIYLNTSDLPATITNRWNDTAPTSSVFSLGTENEVNGTGNTYLAYCFAEVEGFSKFGSYVANASTNGPFVYCGFRPAWVIFFSIAGSGAGRWMLDSARDIYNPADSIVQSNSSAAESSGSSYYLDFVSNGFKVRTSSDFNSSGRTIAYMAFAESPFKTANAR